MTDAPPSRTEPWMSPWMQSLGLLLLAAAPWPQPPFWSQRAALGLLGLGMLLGHRDPLRHWPQAVQALVAGLGLTGWALGWAGPGPTAWLAGSLGLLLALPSVRLLGQAWRAQLATAEAGRAPLHGVMAEALNQHGASLLSRSREAPQLVVFLRHFGCMFCREALAQLARDRAGIEASGTRLVLVHMASDAEARDFFDRYGLADVDRIADPRRWLYFQLGLGRASLWHLLDLRAWWRSFSAAVLNRHGIGRLTGSALQMPGVFLVHRGTLVSAFVHRTPADRPDYRQLSICPPLPHA